MGISGFIDHSFSLNGPYDKRGISDFFCLGLSIPYVVPFSMIQGQRGMLRVAEGRNVTKI